MSSGRIASRYANALVEFSNEKGIAQELYDNTQLLAKVFAQNPDFTNMLTDQSSSTQQKVETLEKILAGKVNPALIDLIRIMVEKHRASYIFNALLLFQHQYRKEHKILEVRVESAKELGSNELNHITQFIKDTYQTAISITTEVKPELVAGIVIIVDGKMVDLSVSGQLKYVRKALGVN